MSARLLVLVCSCHKYIDRKKRAVDADGCRRKRQTCRDTWLDDKPAGVDYAFFVGGDAPEGEADVWGLDAPDTYKGLPDKVRAAFARAMTVPGWQWLYKCDDDTFCHLPRLMAVLDHLEANPTGKPVLFSGTGDVQGIAFGVGYLLPRALVEAIAADNSYNKEGPPLEDRQVTWAALRAGAELISDSRIQPREKPEPTPQNFHIACAQLTPQDMQRISASLADGRKTVHQWWAGDAMPDNMREWCAGVRAWAQARGWKYHLWTREETEAMFAGEDATRILARCREVLPTATTAGLASDWWRYRILAQFGGLWLDTDYMVRDAAHLDAWQPTADLATMAESWDASLPSIGCLWCRGARGHDAARLICAAAADALRRILPLDAPDFAQRYIQTVRRDTCRSGIAKMGIGPWRMRAEFLPRIVAAGYSYEVMPPDVCADRRACATSALLHHGSGSWRESGTDWQARASKAVEMDRQQARPAWQKPQSARSIPQAVRRTPPTLPPARPEDAGDGLVIPRNARRIVILSNITQDFDPRALPLMPGDHCIHINYARQFLRVVDTPGVTHALVVRRGAAREGRRVRWYDPPVHDGFLQVLHVLDVRMRARRKWWRDYCQQHPRKSPTTGFICWHLAREATPGLPVVLCGFAPGEHFGTPLWHGHAWAHEAAAYARAGACIVRPDAPHMRAGILPRVGTLVLVCSSMSHQERREAARASWCKDVPPGVAVRFWCGAEDAPQAADAHAGDVVRLPGVPHASAALPAATMAAVRWAVTSWDFHRVFLCHDDTYTALDRLARFILPQGAAAVGNPDAHRSAIALHGGAGILMTRGMAELIAYHQGRPAPAGTDVLLSRMVQQCGGILTPDRRFSPNMDRVPAIDNGQITAHGCRKGDMARIYEDLRQC